MPPLPKYRKAKRPTVLVNKRSQIKRKNMVNKSCNLVLERLKANNIALAKALSKEKEECQYLFTEKVHLTSQLQELNVAVNQRNAAMIGILKNSSEILEYLVEATERVTRTIAACQQFVGIQRLPSSDSSPSTSTVPHRESTRRSTVKSPARGVVQPMVSGHTITKPVINLSRINMPRVRTSPNLSDIEESLSPDRNQSHSETPSPVRIAQNQSTILTNRRVEGLLPERIRLTSTRLTDESDRLSDRKSRRLSDRRSSRHSRKISRSSDHQLSPNQSLLNIKSPPRPSPNRSRMSSGCLREMIRSPRVTLEDVSKFLQKSQTINVRTLLKSCVTNQNLQDTISQSINKNRNNNNSRDSNVREEEELRNKNQSIDLDLSPTYNFDPRLAELKKQNKTDDPLEGPSWLYNSNETNNSIDDPILPQNSVINNPTETNPSNNCDKEKIPCKQRSPLKSSLKKSETPKKHWSINNFQSTIPSLENDEDSDDSDKCENLSQYLVAYNSKSNSNENDNIINVSPLPDNVTKRRGAPRPMHDDDDDDMTLILNQRMQQNHPVPFDMNELVLPVLETPLDNPLDVEPEPEITTTVRMLTNNINRIPSMTNERFSVMGENTSVICPDIRDSNIRLSSDFENDNGQTSQDDETFTFNRNILKRKRTKKIRIDSSSSDSEPTVSSKKPSIRKNNISSRKDPSSAKVVLEKLDSSTKMNTLSPLSARSSSNLASFSSQQDGLSDSESSNASSKTSIGRPRRQKAPANLMEPKLNTKLRRF